MALFGKPGLHTLLAAAPAPFAEHDERLAWLEDLADYLTRGGRDGYEARLKHLLKRIEDSPEWREGLRRTLLAWANESSALELFADTGIPTDASFLGEAMSRLSKKFLPQAQRLHELSETLPLLLPPDAAAALSMLAPPVRDGVLALWEGFDPARLRKDAVQARQWLAAQAAALALRTEFKTRLGAPESEGIPFLDLVTHVTLPDVDATAVLAALDRCRIQLLQVHGHLEETGVSVGLVYRLEKIQASLARIEKLTFCLALPEQERILAFAAELAIGSARDHSLRAHFRAAVRRLARKVVERAGDTGEHYITTTAAEWRHMLLAAAGGGALTAGTAALKFGITGWHLPMFFEGVFATLNFAGSFLLMQALGFKLATKQPSMTGAALAAHLEISGSQSEPSGFVELVARISRSQFAAIVGNLGMVIPVALAIDWAHVRLLGAHVLGHAKAVDTVHALHPLLSLTVPLAALTGVLLWLSSLFSGWVENWSVCHGLPDAIALDPRLRRWLGTDRARRLSAVYRAHISGIAGSVSLGVLLAFTPIVGRFLGLPLDSRHVTLSTGSAVFGFSALPWRGTGGMASAFGATVGGIVLIALGNFLVSFALALWVALRARALPQGRRLALLRAIGARLVRQPLSFLFPN